LKQDNFQSFGFSLCYIRKTRLILIMLPEYLFIFAFYDKL